MEREYSREVVVRVQERLRATVKHRVSRKEASRMIEDILPDYPPRPGLPLRILLREGLIPGGVKIDRLWYIDPVS